MSDSLWPCRRSPPGSYVHAIFQARILEWVAISFSRNSSQPRDWNHVSCVYCIGRRVLYHCATSEDIWYISCRPNINNQILYIDHFLILCRHRMQIILMAIYIYVYQFSSVQSQLCLTLCDHMNCSTLDTPVQNQLPEFTQTHVLWVQWCHPTISSSVVPFSSCLQSLLTSESFQMSQFFASGGQSFGVSVSASVLPMNIQDWFPLDGLVGSPCSPRDSQESSPTPHFKSINSLGAQLSI